jgi:hypothetical protein
VAVLKSHAQARWLAVQQGEDFHAVASSKTPCRCGLSKKRAGSPASKAEQRRVAFFPTVSLSARRNRPFESHRSRPRGSGLRIPAGVTGALACADSRRQIFFETNILLNDQGACEAAMFCRRVREGEYLATLRLPGREQFRPFQVADFQTPAFEIELAGRPVWLAGEKPKVTVAARYFFGKPLTRAKVRWWLNAPMPGSSRRALGLFNSSVAGRNRAGVEGRAGSLPMARASCGTEATWWWRRKYRCRAKRRNRARPRSWSKSPT